MRTKENRLGRILAWALALCLVLGLMPAWDAPARAAGGVWSGSGTEEDPWEIVDADDLLALANGVNGGNSYDGKWFKLTRDVDLSGTAWRPIGGGGRWFGGTFLGGGHSITGLDVNGSSTLGLFGALSGTVRNLSVSGHVSGSSETGGIAGISSGTIENCDFTGSVSASLDTGGIVGKMTGGKVSGCINRAEVDGNGQNYVGGVTGRLEDGCVIENCTNAGGIRGGYATGGIAGRSCGYVSGCVNTGSVSADDYDTSSAVAGGIVGDLYSGDGVYNCANAGEIRGTGSTGGIVGGVIKDSSASSISNCRNTGTIVGGNGYTGGIVGNGRFPVVNCTNSGEVSGKGNVGGIAGFASETPSGCVNSGKVSGTENVGGIAGRGSPKNCVNKGNVTGTSYVGGITGKGSAEKCRNDSRVEGKEYLGGIAGEANGDKSINQCGNTGRVTAFTDNPGENAGGVVGYLRDSTVSDCYDLGVVWGYEKVGGIAGYARNSSILRCYCKAPTSNGEIDGEDGIDCQVKTADDINHYARCGALVGEAYNKVVKLERDYWYRRCSNRALGWDANSYAHIGDDYDYYDYESRFNNSDNFKKWDFKSTWYIDPGVEVPRLQWEKSFKDPKVDPPGGDGNVVTELRLKGSGTENDPYLITWEGDWEELSHFVSAGNKTSGVFFRQMADITVSMMVGTSVSKFSGTYDGGGKTITFNATADGTANGCAPFCYIDGASFKNMNIEGTINTTYKFAGGLAAHAWGACSVCNCRSGITINSSISSDNADGTHSGFICVLEKTSDTAVFEGCSVEAQFLLSNAGARTAYCGGFVGWSNGKVTFKNCMFAPKAFTWNSSFCFSRNAKDENMQLENCWRIRDYDGNQGAKVYSVTAGPSVTLSFGTAAVSYDVSGISLPAFLNNEPKGVEYGGTFYAEEGKSVQFAPSSTFSGAEYIASAGTIEKLDLTAWGGGIAYFLTMPGQDVEININVVAMETPRASFTATGPNKGYLTGLERGAEYSLTGAEPGTFICNEEKQQITGLKAGPILLVRLGNGATTCDSRPQRIIVSQSAKPELVPSQPGTDDVTGSIPTTTAHEYRTESTVWARCTGETTGLQPGTYYVRTAAYGTYLASETQTIVLRAADTLRYLDPTDKNEPEKTIDTYRTVSGQTELRDGWYVVRGDATLSGRLTVSGSVDLLLCDFNTLKVPFGITVEKGSSLTIWAQSEGKAMGALFAGTNDGTDTACEAARAGIGSSTAEAGAITINGGSVTAHGGADRGAGIGSVQYKGITTITINGGTVTAVGARFAAGIGCGPDNGSPDAGKVTITGGTVNASNLGSAAGIGGGTNGYACDVEITGGTVIARAGANDKAWNTKTQAIGCGQTDKENASGKLTITGLMAYASEDDTEPAAAADRESACRGTWVKLTECVHSGKWTCGEDEHHRTCVRCGELLEEGPHAYGEPVWTWTETEDGYSAKAEFTCSVCKDAKELAAEVAFTTSDPTYFSEGSTVYTAKVTFGGTDYTDTKTVTIPALDARDLDGNGVIDVNDGVYLFMNRLYGSEAYPLPVKDETPFDFNKDGKTDLSDAAALLFEASPASVKDGRIAAAAYDGGGRLTALKVLAAGEAVSAADPDEWTAAAKVKFIFMDKGFMPALAAEVRDAPAGA